MNIVTAVLWLWLLVIILIDSSMCSLHAWVVSWVDCSPMVLGSGNHDWHKACNKTGCYMTPTATKGIHVGFGKTLNQLVVIQATSQYNICSENSHTQWHNWIPSLVKFEESAKLSLLFLALKPNFPFLCRVGDVQYQKKKNLKDALWVLQNFPNTCNPKIAQKHVLQTFKNTRNKSLRFKVGVGKGFQQPLLVC